MPGRTHSREFKLAIVRQVANGEQRPAQICREHHLDERVLLRWRKEYDARGEACAGLCWPRSLSVQRYAARA